MIGGRLSFVLLGALILLACSPLILMGVRKVWRLLFRRGSEVRWVYVAWFLMLASTMVWSSSAQAVNTSAEAAGASNYVRFAFLGLGVAVTSVIAAKHHFTFVGHLVAPVLGLFFALATWNFVTVLWSVSPSVTLYKSFEYLAALFLIATVLSIRATRFPAKTLEKRLSLIKAVFDWHWFLIFLLLLGVYLGLFLRPSLALAPSVGMFDFQLQGVFPQTSANGVGDFAAILGTVAVARLLCRPRPLAGDPALPARSAGLIYALILVFCLITMILAQSRSPILGFLLAVIVVSIASRRYLLFLLTTIVLCSVFFSNYGNVDEVTYDYMRRGQAEGNVESLSGRIFYWEAALEETSEQPWGGYGAYAGGRYILEEIGSVGVSSLHNTYMEVVVGSGVVGLTILVIGLGTTLFWLCALRSRAALHPIGWLLWVESLGIFAVMLLRSIFSVPFVWSHVLTLGLIVILVGVLRQDAKRPVRRKYANTTATQPLSAARR